MFRKARTYIYLIVLAAVVFVAGFLLKDKKNPFSSKSGSFIVSSALADAPPVSEFVGGGESAGGESGCEGASSGGGAESTGAGAGGGGESSCSAQCGEAAY